MTVDHVMKLSSTDLLHINSKTDTFQSSLYTHACRHTHSQACTHIEINQAQSDSLDCLLIVISLHRFFSIVNHSFHTGVCHAFSAVMGVGATGIPASGAHFSMPTILTWPSTRIQCSTNC